MRRLAAGLLLALAAALAGCSAPEADVEAPPADEPAPTPDQARALMAEAANATPERQGVQFLAVRHDEQLVAGEADVERETEIVHAQVRLAPAMLASSPQASAFSQVAGGSDVMRVYLGVNGSAVLVGETVLLLTQEQARGSLGELMRPDLMLAKLVTGNITIHNVTRGAHDGAPVVIVNGTYHDGPAPQPFDAYVAESPPRLARVVTLVTTEGATLTNATVTLDAVAPDALALPDPRDLGRAIELRHASDRGQIGFGGGWETWVFHATRGPPLSELSAEVAFAGRPAEWSMPLTEARKEQGGVSLEFDDADGDGHLSAGDTLRIHRDAARSFHVVMLRDHATELRVVPGLPVALVAVGILALALLWRQR